MEEIAMLKIQISIMQALLSIVVDEVVKRDLQETIMFAKARIKGLSY